jgi:hypothetical protein
MRDIGSRARARAHDDVGITGTGHYAVAMESEVIVASGDLYRLASADFASVWGGGTGLVCDPGIGAVISLDDWRDVDPMIQRTADWLVANDYALQVDRRLCRPRSRVTLPRDVIPVRLAKLTYRMLAQSRAGVAIHLRLTNAARRRGHADHMRRSSVVRLTLLPLLASAAVAAAQPGPDQPVPDLSPPGMTPTIDDLDCDHDPNWQLRDDCAVDDDGQPIVVRSGFGAYFWSGAGG